MDNWRDPWADEDEIQHSPTDDKPTFLNPNVDTDSWTRKPSLASPGWGKIDGFIDNGWADLTTNQTVPQSWAGEEEDDEERQDADAGSLVDLKVKSIADKDGLAVTHDEPSTWAPRDAVDRTRALDAVFPEAAKAKDWAASEVESRRHGDHSPGPDRKNEVEASEPETSIHAVHPSDQYQSVSLDQTLVLPLHETGHGRHEIKDSPSKTGVTPALGPDNARDADLANLLPSKRHASSLNCDPSLLDKLFPLTIHNSTDTAQPTDPVNMISSITARRMWYRISRIQPMREIERGEPDETYVRVAWPGSQVREKALDIIEKWANEHRLRGRLFNEGGTAAPFNWSDSPALQQGRSISDEKQKAKALTEASAPPTVAAQTGENAPGVATASPVMLFSWSTHSPASVADESAVGNYPLASSQPVPSLEYDANPSDMVLQPSKSSKDTARTPPANRKWEIHVPHASLSKPLSPTTANQRVLLEARRHQDPYLKSSMNDQSLASGANVEASRDIDSPPKYDNDSVTSELQHQDVAAAQPQEPDWGDFFAVQEAKAEDHATPVLQPDSPAAVKPPAPEDNEFEWAEVPEPFATDVTLQSDDFEWAEPALGNAGLDTVASPGFAWASGPEPVISASEEAVITDVETGVHSADEGSVDEHRDVDEIRSPAGAQSRFTQTSIPSGGGKRRSEDYSSHAASVFDTRLLLKALPDFNYMLR